MTWSEQDKQAFVAGTRAAREKAERQVLIAHWEAEVVLWSMERWSEETVFPNNWCGTPAMYYGPKLALACRNLFRVRAGLEPLAEDDPENPTLGCPVHVAGPGCGQSCRYHTAAIELEKRRHKENSNA